MPRTRDLLAPIKKKEAPIRKEKGVLVSARKNPPERGPIDPYEEVLTTEEAAQLTKMSVIWLKKQRCAGGGPPYLRRGRTVRYLKSELLTWWSEQRPDRLS